MKEEEERKCKTPYLFIFVLSGITTIIFGIWIGAFHIGNPFKLFSLENKTNLEEEVQTALLTYQVTDKEYTDEDMQVTANRIKKRLAFWDKNGIVKILKDGKIEVRMQRDYAGDANIQILTQEEKLYMCIKCSDKPTKDQLKSGEYFKSSNQYYRNITFEEGIGNLEVIPTINQETEDIKAVLTIEIPETIKERIKKIGSQNTTVYLMYNEELLGIEEVRNVVRNEKIQIISDIGTDRANVIKKRIEIGNLPLKLELVSNEQ